jgi:formamidopyrimidine-DNA glycosylase
LKEGGKSVPELPEIVVFARDMRKELVGRTINSVEVLQPKCLNLPVEDFQAALSGAEVRDVTPRGKWLQVKTTRGWLLLSLGMGGEILLASRKTFLSCQARRRRFPALGVPVDALARYPRIAGSARHSPAVSKVQVDVPF